MFEKEIIRATHPNIYRVEIPKNAVQLPPSEIAAHILTQMPDSLRLSSLTVYSDPEEAWMAGFENMRQQTLSVNPYTGDINGWTTPNQFFQTTRKLHRWLMDAPPRKGAATAGKTIVGVTTLVMVVILVSGLVLWVPRNKRALKHRLRVSCTNGWRRFWYDSHVALGFYATLFLLVMALTGLTWSFSWYRKAAYSLFGASALQEEATTAAKSASSQKEREHKDFDFTVWDRALNATKAAYTMYQSIKLETGTIEVSTTPSSTLRKIDRIRFNHRTGEITETSCYEDTPVAQKLKGWFYAFHTGSWGGIWTKTLYFLAAIIGGLLPLSGYYLWYRRNFHQHHKRHR